MNEQHGTSQEWIEKLTPFLSRALTDQDARKQLTRMHAPDKETYLQRPWENGATEYIAINSRSLIIKLIESDVKFWSMEYDRNGRCVRTEACGYEDGSAQGQQCGEG